MLSLLEKIRISDNDTVVFTIGGGSVLTGSVIDSSDPALLRVKLENGVELRIGRGSVLTRIEQPEGDKC